MAKDIFYVELSKAKIQDKRNVVISGCSKGGFTIAQQLCINEGNKSTKVFLKGAIHVDTVEGLKNIRDAINVAIKESEEADEVVDDIIEVVDESIEEENEDGEWD